MVLERRDARGHVLIISHDVAGARMAGPGIRYYHLAQVLAREFEVVLAAPAESALGVGGEASRSAGVPEATGPAQGFRVLPWRSGDDVALAEAIQEARAVLVPAVWLAQVPSLLRTPVPLVVDGYNPVLAETLALGGDTSRLQRALTQAYLAGDFFICASERQRDWWLGLLDVCGRINRFTYREDPSLRGLVDVVPFGMPELRPQHSRSVLRERWPDIGEEDHVVLWGGGLWKWLDPLTAIRAVAKIWQQRQDVRLVFPGTRHPNPAVGEISTQNEAALQMAQDLALLDRAIFFGDWVPYADWPSVLLESDIALTLHHDTLETRLAFRSRVLSYVWAGLPVVATRGDATSEMIAQHDIGFVVDYEDVGGVCDAVIRLLETPRGAFARRFEVARQSLTWEQAARPLIEFCRHPRQAPDKIAVSESGSSRSVGNPYYLDEIVRLRKDVSHLRTVIEGYEEGRFIRLTRRLHTLKERLGWH